MKEVRLETESFLFESSQGRFRAIPFYELSIYEWVIYESGIATYYFTFDNRSNALIQSIKEEMNNGKDLDEIIKEIGAARGKAWTVKHDIEGKEVDGSGQMESVVLQILSEKHLK